MVVGDREPVSVEVVDISVVHCSDEYCLRGLMQNFQQFLNNIFQPLFYVTLHPDADPALDSFLQLVRR